MEKRGIKRGPKGNDRRDPAGLSKSPKRSRGRGKRSPKRVAEAGAKAPLPDRHLTWKDAELPDSYSETRVVLVAVEPYLVHVYWDVSRDDIGKAKRRLSSEYSQSQAVLRFFELSDAVSKRTIHTFDVEIEISAANWYVPLWSPEKTYRVVLGLRTRSNRFFALARSNIANTSRSSAAAISGERYAQVTEDFEVFEVRLDPVSQETSPEGPRYRIPQNDLTLAAAEKPSTNEYVGESFPPDAKVIGGTRTAATTEEAPVSRHRGKEVGRKDREQRKSVNDVYAARTPDADDIFCSRLHEFSELRMHRLAPSKENEASPFDRGATCQEKTNRKEFSDLTARSEHEFNYGESS